MKSHKKTNSKGPTTKEIMKVTGCAERTAARLRQKILADGTVEPLDEYKTAKHWQGRRWKALALLAEMELETAQRKLIKIEEIQAVIMLANTAMSFAMQSLVEEIPPHISGKDAIDCHLILQKAVNAAFAKYIAEFDKYWNDHRTPMAIAAEVKAKSEAKLVVTKQNATITS